MKWLGNFADRHTHIPWPPLPWRCPRCEVECHTLSTVVATTVTAGPLRAGDVTLFCVLCDLFTFMEEPS